MNFQLWDNIYALVEASGLSEAHFAHMMGMGEKQFYALRLAAKDIPLDAAVRLSENFQVDIHTLLVGKIDDKAAERFFKKGPIELPERYRSGQFSKLRSVLNLLEGVRVQRGVKYLETILRHSQIPRAFFDDPEKTINVRFITDLTELLVSRGWTKQDLYGLGQYSFHTHRKTAFGDTLASYGDWQEVYEALVIQHASAFDRNYDYQLRLCTDERVIIDAIPREEVCEALKTKVFDAESTCLTRMGVMSTVSCYISEGASQVVKLKSVHNGDGFNRYEITPSERPLLN